jgi:acetyl-CoA carboxylase biotin carboxylase subunit
MCESHGIKFIGPTGDMIRMMGDKARAKELMKSAGVPTVPGSDGLVETYEDALDLVNQIGLPVIIKATAGGGGKGMRLVRDINELKDGFHTAKAESAAAFGNSGVYIEKYIENPRHIEIQLLGDGIGNVIHLGERECSIQRRHQKLVEECPSCAISPAQRKEIGLIASKGASLINYEGAGKY